MGWRSAILVCLRLSLPIRSLSQELFISWLLLGMKGTSHSDQTNLHTNTSQFYWASEITAFFYELKVCGNPASSKSISNIVPTPLAHFMFLSHCRNSWNIPYFFISIIIFVTVICDHWSLMSLLVIVLGCHKLCPYNTENLINVCVLTSPLTDHFPVFLLLLWLYWSLRHNIIWLRGYCSIADCPQCSSEMNSHTSLNSNQRLDMTKLNEKTKSKSKIS